LLNFFVKSHAIAEGLIEKQKKRLSVEAHADIFCE